MAEDKNESIESTEEITEEKIIKATEEILEEKDTLQVKKPRSVKPSNERTPRTKDNSTTETRRMNREARPEQRKKNPSNEPTRKNEYEYLDENDEIDYNKRKRKKLIKRILIWTPISIILIGILGVCIKFYKPVSEIKASADEIISKISIEDFKLASNTHIYDNSGNEMFSVNKEKNVEYLDYDAVPVDVFNCFIAVEDVRFYEHSGVDYKSIARAGVSMVKNHGEITQGGSTLTQQLVKLTYLTTEQSYKRKLKEIFVAMEIEKKFTKKQILEFYVNNVYYGNDAYGINSASIKYFNKGVGELSLSQIAYLCSIPNSPNMFNPYTIDEEGDNKKTLERRNLFLDKLLEHNFVTQEQHDKAIAEKIVIERPSTANGGFDTRKGFIEKEVVELLMKQNGFDFKYSFASEESRKAYITTYNDNYKIWRSKFYKKGYKVYTSFNEDLQKQVQTKLDSSFAGESEKTTEGIYKRQASSITLDNSSGLIITMIGGRTSEKTDYLNRAYNVQRQNGSTMKPLAVYGPAVDTLGYLPSTTEEDSKEDDGPKNSEGTYSGVITIREALRRSVNTVAYKTYRKVTPTKGLKYLQNMQFEYITPSDVTLASGLGGLTVGTNPQEVSGGFATLANGGRFNKPTCIVEIKDSADSSLYKHVAENKQVYKPLTSVLMIDMLKTVTASGTGTSANFNSAIEIGGKTGTTDDNKDLWFAGFSPKYTTVVWTGYDQPQKFQASANNSAPALWREIMKIMHKDGVAAKFEYNNLVKWVNINAEGKEVPVGTEGSRSEVFPMNFEVPKGVITHEADKKAFASTLDGILNAASAQPNDSLVLATQLSNVKIIMAQINTSALNDEEKKATIDYANYTLQQIQNLKKNSNPTTKVDDNTSNMPGSTEMPKTDDKGVGSTGSTTDPKSGVKSEYTITKVN